MHRKPAWTCCGCGWNPHPARTGRSNDGTLAGVGAARLHVLFRHRLDTTPQTWLTTLRLREAMAKLADGDQPIARIAQDGGWSDQSSLTRAMRRIAGCTPASYRRRHRG
jgi:AraC-like DNA-binding protein